MDICVNRADWTNHKGVAKDYSDKRNEFVGTLSQSSFCTDLDSEEDNYSQTQENVVNPRVSGRKSTKRGIEVSKYACYHHNR